jgi:hypothetical protein
VDFHCNYISADGGNGHLAGSPTNPFGQLLRSKQTFQGLISMLTFGHKETNPGLSMP